MYVGVIGVYEVRVEHVEAVIMYDSDYGMVAVRDRSMMWRGKLNGGNVSNIS
jgi:hypothetical protein